MKILSLHCDYIKFKPLKKALKSVNELSSQDKKTKEVEECLVILTAIEKTDRNAANSAKLLAKNIQELASQVKASKVVLYPYAHLSSELAAPDIAEQTLIEAEKLLKKKFQVIRAPFGYYKEFELKCKGHPLSELSREITSGGVKVEKREKVIEDKDEKYDPKKLLREISKTILDKEKLKEQDHRILGQKMDLFSFHGVAPGMVFWHNNGLIIYNELVKYWREMHEKAGYREISTPQILDSKLWKISGHWRLYKENMFLTDYEKRLFAVKPMNCPGCMLLYRQRPRSYKELPMRVGELGIVHRKELSGVLSGLFRVIKFTQDDAHIFCTEKQLRDEIINVINLFKIMLDKFSFKYSFTLSVRSQDKKDKYLGTDDDWKKAEKTLSDALKKLKIKFSIEKGEAKFYGPSLDVQIKDSLGRKWQCSTLQLDFLIPERFQLKYIDENNKEKTPIMLHRVVYGALERFIGVLLEHTNGNLPTWLSPVQVRVVSFTDRNKKAVEKIIKQIAQEIPQIRIDADFRNESVDYKVREAEIQRVAYIIVIGDKEEKSGTIALRERGKKPQFGVKLDKFIDKLKKEIEEREW